MIWFKPYTLEDLQSFRNKTNLIEYLGVEIVALGDDYLVARMPVTANHHQINGILHGGVTCVLVETVGSVASLMCIDLAAHYCVGSQINVNHIRQVKEGYVVATCKAVHVGRQKHVWDVMVRAEATDKLIAKGELTCAVLSL